jgi:hypothetical protein
MSDPADAPTGRVCPSCGTENGPNARFCAECGTRLVDDEALARDFESTVAAVVDEPGTADNPTVEVEVVRPIDPDETAAQGDVVYFDQQPAPEQPTEWPTTFQEAPRSRNTTLWIILGIIAFILACCCGLGLLVTVTSANDSALHRELSHFAATALRTQ